MKDRGSNIGLPADRKNESRNHQGTNIGPHFTQFQTKTIFQSLTLSTAQSQSAKKMCAALLKDVNAHHHSEHSD